MPRSAAAASSSDDWRPWFAGAAAGSCMTCIGHPFDTTKVRMQTSLAYTSTAQCVASTVRNEGALALYKGLAPALATTCVTSGLRFGVQHRINTWLGGVLGGGDDRSFEGLPTLARVAAEGGGGAACGLVLPLVFTPMELIKCKRQVLKDNAVSNWQIARGVWRERGLRGLYTGHTMTVVRSTLGNGALFASYELFRGLLHGGGRGGAGRLGTTHLDMAAGVLSGWAALVACFPFDGAKSRMQVASSGSAVLPVLAEMYREGALYRGLAPMLARAVPVHMVYLPCYTFLIARLAPRPAPCQAPSASTLRRSRSTGATSM